MSTAESGSNGGGGAGAPGQDDPDALVEDIDRTRAELGDTVEALVAKVDVKAQAQQRAAEVSTQAKGKLQAVKQNLAGRATRLTGQAEQTRQAAASNGKTVLGAGSAAWGSAPEPVQRGAQRVGHTVGRHRVPFAVAAGVVLVAVAGWLAVRRRRS